MRFKRSMNLLNSTNSNILLFSFYFCLNFCSLPHLLSSSHILSQVQFSFLLAGLIFFPYITNKTQKKYLRDRDPERKWWKEKPKSNPWCVDQFNNLLISCHVKGCFAILTQKKKVQKKKLLSTLPHSQNKLLHHISSHTPNQINQSIKSIKRFKIIKKHQQKDDKIKYNSVLKIKNSSMFNKNFHNFFWTIASNFMERGISILITKKEHIKRKSINNNINISFDKQQKKTLKHQHKDDKISITWSWRSTLAPCSIRIFTISLKPLRAAL